MAAAKVAITIEEEPRASRGSGSASDFGVMTTLPGYPYYRLHFRPDCGQPVRFLPIFPWTPSTTMRTLRTSWRMRREVNRAISGRRWRD